MGLSVLPRRLGYTLTYMCVQAANLTTSAVIDACGLAGHTVLPLNFSRITSIGGVLLGAVLFSAFDRNKPSNQNDEGSPRDTMTTSGRKDDAETYVTTAGPEKNT